MKQKVGGGLRRLAKDMRETREGQENNMGLSSMHGHSAIAQPLLVAED